MTRAAQAFSIALLVSAIYFACFFGLIPFPAIIQKEIIPVLPLWAIVSFGALLLFKLGWGIVTFNDVPEAHESLMKEIELARKDLRTKGVEVD